MRSTSIIYIFCCCVCFPSFGQLVNQDNFLKISEGTILKMEGSVEIQTTGIIDNNGTLSLSGDFQNSGYYDASDLSILRFTGNGHSEIQSNSDPIYELDLQKEPGYDLHLLDELSIVYQMTFSSDNNKVILGDHNLHIEGFSGLGGYDNNDYIITNGPGMLYKHGDSPPLGVFTYPVGYDQWNYNPLSYILHAGHVSDQVGVRCLEHVYTDGLNGPAITRDAIDVSWEVVEQNPGGSHMTLELEWTDADTLQGFDEDNCAPSHHDGSNWDMLYTDLETAYNNGPYNIMYDSTEELGVFSVGGRSVAHGLALDLKTYLQGPFSGGMMTDWLRVKSLIPEEEPFTATSYSHSGFGGKENISLADLDNAVNGDDIVDWMLVELRDADNSASVLSSTSALIQRDGDVVDLNGDSILQVPGFPNGDYYVSLRHRNHIGVMTPDVLSLSGMKTSYDFIGSAAQAYNGIQADLGGGIYGMYAGNANGMGGSPVAFKQVRMTGPASINDYEALLGKLGGVYTNLVLNTYAKEDINLDGNVRMTGPAVINDYEKLLGVLGGVYTNIIVQPF